MEHNKEDHMKNRLISWRTTMFATLTLLAHVVFGEDWHCKDGKIYQNVRYMRHNPSAVQFSHSAGISIEKFTNLPDDIQKRYGYDPQKVLQAREEMQKRKRYECIKVEKDEFNGLTTIGLNELYLEKTSATELKLDTYYIAVSTNYIAKLAKVHMNFVSIRDSGYDWRFLNYHSVYFLIDGTPWQPNEDYDSDLWIRSSSLYERISISMSMERMESMINAKTVRFKIGGSEFTLPKDYQQKMGVLLEYLRENYNVDPSAQ